MMEWDQQTIILVSAFGAALLLLMIICLILCVQVSVLRRMLVNLSSGNRIKVQKLKVRDDNNHAFQNPNIVPNEELSRRGYSMYVSTETDLESGRDTDRQTGGKFVEELAQEIQTRHQRQSTAPQFLLQGIEDNKRKSWNLSNPLANNRNSRDSDTNPNFIY